MHAIPFFTQRDTRNRNWCTISLPPSIMESFPIEIVIQHICPLIDVDCIYRWLLLTSREVSRSFLQDRRTTQRIVAAYLAAKPQEERLPCALTGRLSFRPSNILLSQFCPPSWLIGPKRSPLKEDGSIVFNDGSYDPHGSSSWSSSISIEAKYRVRALALICQGRICRRKVSLEGLGGVQTVVWNGGEHSQDPRHVQITSRRGAVLRVQS